MSEISPCQRCGQPCTKSEFFRRGSEKVWMHPLCMVEAGEELIASGRMDDVRIIVAWPDGVSEITLGKNLRKSLRGD
jgi:hypothetical protein